MEFKLNEDQQMIHDLAKDFAETVLQPRIDEIEQGGPCQGRCTPRGRRCR